MTDPVDPSQAYAAEDNITQRLNGCNFENGAWQISTNVATVTNSSGFFEIATEVPHGLYTGALAVVGGTAGAAGLNGTWTVTAVDPTHVILQGSTYAPGYAGGGTISGGLSNRSRITLFHEFGYGFPERTRSSLLCSNIRSVVREGFGRL